MWSLSNNNKLLNFLTLSFLRVSRKIVTFLLRKFCPRISFNFFCFLWLSPRNIEHRWDLLRFLHVCILLYCISIWSKDHRIYFNLHTIYAILLLSLKLRKRSRRTHQISSLHVNEFVFYIFEWREVRIHFTFLRTSRFARISCQSVFSVVLTAFLFFFDSLILNKSRYPLNIFHFTFWTHKNFNQIA